jgi:hypothetical protein
MRSQFVTLTIIAVCVAAIGAWLVVSLVNEFSNGKSLGSSSLAIAGPDVPVAGLQAAGAPLERRNDEDDPPPAVVAEEPPARSTDARFSVPGTAGEGAPEAEAEKLTARIEQQDPAPLPPRILPREAGPYRAAFIREPPSENAFPVIGLGEVIWRVDPAADGSVTAELDIVAAESGQRAGLRLAGAVTSAGEAVLLVTLSLGEGEFLPKADSLAIEAITARGRGDRSVRISAITLPYERPDVVDFRISADALIETLSFANWFDIALRIDGEPYTITIQNWAGSRDIVSAIAYGA